MCLFGDWQRPLQVVDLEWTATPVTPAQLGLRPRPPVGLAQAQAARIAADPGGRLPLSKEWEWAVSGTERRPDPWGEDEPDESRANLHDVCGRRTPLDSHPRGRTPTGLWDMAGNCWEWTASKTIGGGFVIRGATPLRCTPGARSRTPRRPSPPRQASASGWGDPRDRHLVITGCSHRKAPEAGRTGPAHRPPRTAGTVGSALNPRPTTADPRPPPYSTNGVGRDARTPASRTRSSPRPSPTGTSRRDPPSTPVSASTSPPPADAGDGQALSVVIHAGNTDFALPTVLDAISAR
ncbi:formylglycine-generating enzyme family protein [Kitasatospora sp. NPDC059973]|uniref:formylglycine-generating enzyme family protein n=1 Tax=Kitasatospora sp. NPDC059973 TaxID=3347020 RepID=UPI00369F214E